MKPSHNGIGEEILGDYVPFVDLRPPSGTTPDSLPAWVAEKLNSSAKGRGREVPPTAQAEAYETLRRLADLWIDSGKNGIEDRPHERNIDWSGTEDATAAFRNMKTIRSMRDELFARIQFRRKGGEEGQTTYAVQWPLYKKGYLGGKYRDQAVLLFAEFLDSPQRNLLGRCDDCSEYFSRLRAPRESIQHGSYCEKCRHGQKARIVRMKATRMRRHYELIRMAADYAPKLKKSRAKDRAEELANLMERNLPTWRQDMGLKSKWVNSYRQEIEAEIERRKHAEG